MSKNKQTHNNNKANQNNPNNKAHKAKIDNRANQKNPNNNATKSNNVVMQSISVAPKRNFKTIYLERDISEIIDLDLLQKVEIKIEYTAKRIQSGGFDAKPDKPNVINIIIKFYMPNNLIQTSFEIVYNHNFSYRESELEKIIESGVDIKNIIYGEFSNYICEFLCSNKQTELFLDTYSIKPYQNIIQAISKNSEAKKVNVNGTKYKIVYWTDESMEIININSVYSVRSEVESIKNGIIQISLSAASNNGDKIFTYKKEIISPKYENSYLSNEYGTELNLLLAFKIDVERIARNELNKYALNFLNGGSICIDMSSIAEKISNELSKQAKKFEEDEIKRLKEYWDNYYDDDDDY